MNSPSTRLLSTVHRSTRSTRAWLGLAALALAAAGCSGGGSPSDAGDTGPADGMSADSGDVTPVDSALPPTDVPGDVAADVPADVGADVGADTPPIDAAGSLSCGTMTCGAGQFCLLDCSGIDAGGRDLHRCMDIPAACGATFNCTCADPCFAHMCMQTGAREVTCTGCV
jgi:hypothetical protein